MKIEGLWGKMAGVRKKGEPHAGRVEERGMDSPAGSSGRKRKHISQPPAKKLGGGRSQKTKKKVKTPGTEPGLNSTIKTN